MPIRGPHTDISTDPIFIQKTSRAFSSSVGLLSYCLLLAGKFIGYVKYLNADGFADFDRLVATSGYYLLLFFRWPGMFMCYCFSIGRQNFAAASQTEEIT